MTALGKYTVTVHQVSEQASGQRIDNYLLKILKGVPKSHIYRILRSGEVRVDKRRVTPDFRVAGGETLRLPPMRLPAPSSKAAPRADPRLEQAVLFEDDRLLALDKPAGL